MQERVYSVMTALEISLLPSRARAYALALAAELEGLPALYESPCVLLVERFGAGRRLCAVARSCSGEMKRYVCPTYRGYGHGQPWSPR